MSANDSRNENAEKASTRTPNKSTKASDQSSTETPDKTDIDAIKEEIDDLRVRVQLASENGLFSKISNTSGQNYLDDILTRLKEVQKSVNTDPIEATHQLSIAKCEFDKSVEKAGRLWRLSYIYGIPTFLYLTGLFIAFLLLWHYVDVQYRGDLSIFWVPAYSLIWGVLGAILQGIYYLWFQVNRGKYRKVWLVYFLSAPFMGCLLGGIIYLIFATGYFATGQPSIQNPQLPMLLSALAGFSWLWAIEVLNKTRGLLSVKSQD